MTLFGIFQDKKITFPLRKTDVNMTSVDGVATTKMRQTYFNESSSRLNSFYKFPIYNNATVNDFTVKFSKGTVKCYVEEIEEAKKTYSAAVSQGKQAALMTERNTEEYDISIGNIDPEETVEVIIEYVSHLERDVDTGGRKFIVPTTLTPRYDNSRNEKKEKVTNAMHSPKKIFWKAPTVRNPPSLYNRTYEGSDVGGAFTATCASVPEEEHDEDIPELWDEDMNEESEKDEEDEKKEMDTKDEKDEKENVPVYSEAADEISLRIKMDVVETKGILGICASPQSRWNGNTVRKERITHERFIYETEAIGMDQDFVAIVLVDEDGKDSKNTQMTAWGEIYSPNNAQEDGKCTMKLIIPEDSLYRAKPDGKYEFIFVIDRSASMYGKQIENARRSLALMLNSLPTDCYFNIYGFGSSWKRFYKCSVKYGKKTFEESKMMVEKIEADMGGTEMNEVIRAIYETQKIDGYDRKIFLLTDGEVYDLQSIFELTAKDPNVPIFTIGVGNAVSHALVNGLSERTNGFCEIIMDADLIEKKVLLQLKRSMYELLTLEINGVNHKLRPGQETLLFTVDMSEFSHSDKENRKEQDFLDVTINDDDTSLFLPVKWTNDSIQEEEEENRKQKDIPGHPLRWTWANQEIQHLIEEMETENDKEARSGVKDKIVAMSKEYKILTLFTAFVGVLEDSEGKVATETVTTPLHPGKYAQSESSLKRRIYQQGMTWGGPSTSPPYLSSTSPKTGSIQVCGGVGVSKSLYAGNVANTSLSDYDADEEDSNTIDIDDWQPRMKKKEKSNGQTRLATLKDDFDTVFTIFSRSMQFDGSVDYFRIRRELNVPSKPDKFAEQGITDDIWATLLFIGFMTIRGKQDLQQYAMMFDKSMKWLQNNKFEREWYEAAIDECSNDF